MNRSAARLLGVLKHRTATFLLVVAALGGLWQTYLGLSAPGRTDAALAAALARERPVNVAVTLPFAPEDFHVRLFQTYGVVSGVRGTTVLIDRVSPADARHIARHYWVGRIALR